MSDEPMIKLDPSGKAPILSYNVPEPTSYSGSNIIELDLSANFFTAAAKKVPAGRGSTSRMTAPQINASIINLTKGVVDRKVFPNIKMINPVTIKAVSETPVKKAPAKTTAVKKAPAKSTTAKRTATKRTATKRK